MAGSIIIPRDFLDWELYKSPDLSRLFLHLLFEAQFSDVEPFGFKLKRGQLRTTVKAMSQELNISVQKLRTALRKLQKLELISMNSSVQGTIITISDFEKFQSYNLD